MTTGFTRIRIPIICAHKYGHGTAFVEKLVLMTSHDRTMVAAHGNRIVSKENMVGDFGYNTPLVLVVDGDDDVTFSIKIHSRGGRVDEYTVEYARKKFQIPNELDVKSTVFTPKEFDAVLKIKSKRN